MLLLLLLLLMMMMALFLLGALLLPLLFMLLLRCWLGVGLGRRRSLTLVGQVLHQIQLKKSVVEGGLQESVRCKKV